MKEETQSHKVDSDHYTFMDGRVHVYRRSNSSRWQCSTFLGGRNHRASTKHDNLELAMQFARIWYMERYVEEQRRKRDELAGSLEAAVQPQPPLVGTASPTDRRRRTTPTGPTFGDACDAFLKEYTVITQGERNARYVAQKGGQVTTHLLPFFGADRPVTEINSGLIQEYRAHRQTSRKNKEGVAKRPARNTLHSETVTLRQILKTANRKGWIAALPDMTVAYKTSGKIEHRAWFSPEEYKMLYEASRERAKNPKTARWREPSENLHDYILFMGNTGLRPDEASHLQARDVTIADDRATGQRILEIAVRGKRGVGYCKSMPGAVHPFERIRDRKKLKPTDPVFGTIQRGLFNSILDELGFKKDREGNPRTTYSLRHTYISMRLMEGADIYQVAKNCRTSVEMIEKYYASHIKNRLDTTLINTRRSKAPKEKPAPAKKAVASKRPAAEARKAKGPRKESEALH